MKKIMSLMLGLSLLTGAVAFARPDDKETTKSTKKSKTKHKKSSDKMTTSNTTK